MADAAVGVSLDFNELDALRVLEPRVGLQKIIEHGNLVEALSGDDKLGGTIAGSTGLTSTTISGAAQAFVTENLTMPRARRLCDSTGTPRQYSEQRTAAAACEPVLGESMHLKVLPAPITKRLNGEARRSSARLCRSPEIAFRGAARSTPQLHGRSLRRWWVAAAGAVLLTTYAKAELEWSKRRLVLEPPAGAAEMTGVFEFVNRGTTPVRIESVRADCGCTAIASENGPVLPGSKGTLRATYHVGSRTGKQAVSVVVRTSEPEARTYELGLDVTIKEFVTVTPGFVFWKLGDETTAKSMLLNLVPGFRFLRIESATDDFSAEVTEQSETAVQFRVSPRNTWAKRTGTLRITVVQGEQPPVHVLAYARVL